MENEASRPMPPASYVNFLQVASRREEIRLSFGQLADGEAQSAHLLASLVTTPAHARAMLDVLGQALEQYDARFGAGEGKPSEDAADPLR